MLSNLYFMPLKHMQHLFQQDMLTDLGKDLIVELEP